MKLVEWRLTRVSCNDFRAGARNPSTAPNVFWDPRKTGESSFSGAFQTTSLICRDTNVSEEKLANSGDVMHVVDGAWVFHAGAATSELDQDQDNSDKVSAATSDSRLRFYPVAP